ncbi:MAG TPA: metal ABC transporter ATP-binding protein [Thermoplasmatales archaeon]|nr:metal ABC transporter ATP-binding protein [Thermoplasmatales archaeon]
MIEVKNVSYSYNGRKAIENVSFSVKKEFVAIMGPNGSGKSTLIKLVMGLLKPDEGEIKIFGEDAEKTRNFIGYMPQKETIAKHFPIKVADIILMGVTNKKFYTKEDIKKAKEILEKVELSHTWNKKFNSLSQGQQQRVLFARALAKEPKIIILDEPFSAVDLPSREKMISLLNERKKDGIEILIVVHNINPVLHDIDKVLLLNKRAIAYGSPKEILNHENLMETYGSFVQIVTCEEGYCHPLIGDEHV